MINKKTSLKNILTTASTLAITLGAVDAVAAPAIVQLNHVAPPAPANFDLKTDTAELNRARNVDAIKLVQDNTVLNVVGADGNRLSSIKGVDINDNNATLNVGAEAFSLGSVINTGADDAKKLNVVFTAATKALNLSGDGVGAIAVNDYRALGDVDFRGRNKALNINATDNGVIEINGNIGSSTTANTGIIGVKTDGIFTGKIGEDKSLDLIKLMDDKKATFSGSIVQSRAIEVGDRVGNASITFGSATDAGTDVTSANGIQGAGANNTIKIKGKAVFNTIVGKNIQSIVIQEASELIVNNKAINAAAIIKADVNGKGKLVLRNVNTHANIGEDAMKLEQVTLDGLNGGNAVALNHEVHATTLDLANATKLILNNNMKAGHITSDGNVENLLELDNDYTINFNVGKDGQDLNINFVGAANKVLTLGDAGGAKDIYGNITNEDANQLTIRTGSTDMAVCGELGSDAKFLAGVEVGTAMGAHKLILGNDVYAPLKFMNADSEIEIFGDMHGKINGNGAAMGKITVAQDQELEFSETIGDVDAVKSLTLEKDSVATLKANSRFDENGIRLGEDSELTIDNIDVVLENGATIEAVDNGQGHLLLNRKNTPAVIGAAAVKLAKVTLQDLALAALADKSTTLAHEIHAQTLDITGNTVLKIDDKIKAEKVTSSGPGAAKLVVDANLPTTINFDVGGLGQLVEINFAKDRLLRILDGKSVYANITAADGKGSVKIEGDTTLGGKIGDDLARIKQFEISGDNRKTVTSDLTDIYAGRIKHGNAKLVLNENLAIHGAYTANGSTLDIGNKTLTFDGQATFNDENIINLTYDKNADSGQITRAAGALPMMINAGAAGVKTITVNVNVINAPAAGDIVTFIDTGIAAEEPEGVLVVFNFVGQEAAAIPAVRTTDGTVGTLKFAAAAAPAPAGGAPAPVVPVAPAADNKDVAPVELPNAELPSSLEALDKKHANASTDQEHAVAASAYAEAISRAIKKSDSQKLDLLAKQIVKDKNAAQADAKVTTEHRYAGLTIAMANGLATSERVSHVIAHTPVEEFSVAKVQSTAATAERRETTQHKAVATTAVAHAGAAVNASISTVATRTASVVTPTISVAPAGVGGRDLQSAAEGIAAGSDVEKYGVWGQAMGGVATQKARKDASGFKSNMIGSMVGADTMINDNAMIGLAFGNVANNVKMKNLQTGDKTRSSSWVFSGYGNYQFDNDFFIRGSVAYTRTAVNNSEKRIITNTKSGIAKAKYNINSFGGELIVGKAFAVSDFTVIPSIGARFTHTGKISYQETGNTGLNAKIAQGAMNSVYGVAGLQVAKPFAVNASIVTPEAHANVAYGVGVKTPKGKFTSQLDNKAVSYIGNKPSRVSADIGCGITAATGALEYGIGYDANIAAGYVGHQGTLKLKVKF